MFNTISETEFLSKADRPFLYVWSSSYAGLFANISVDSEGDRYGFSKSAIQAGIEGCDVPVYVGTGSNSTKILGLFGSEVVAGGFVVGVVNKDATILYDMTDRCSMYRNAGSETTWDTKGYDTSSGLKSNSRYLSLVDGGISLFTDAILSGKYYVSQKKIEVQESQPYLHATTNYTYTEVVTFTNADATIYTYYTNKTVIVDPYFQKLNSVLKFEYPKVITEGDYFLYKLTRGGFLYDPLTVHIITNGHWCANVRWEAKEGGTKVVRVKTGISDEIDDNCPLEVVVKSLSRKVEME